MAQGWYHVFGRGLERREVFLEDRDRSHLLELFETLHERYRIRIHAYALMDRLCNGERGDPATGR
jgi:REP element-mobilizing transposase RayT